MPETLRSTIEDLRQQIVAGAFESEAAISRGVVSRILAALGWPVFNVGIVAAEFTIGKRRVDYALCPVPRKPSALIEVKDLGKADRKAAKQLFEYCFHQGVPIAILTDGQTWSFFLPAGQGNYEERTLASIDLVDDIPDSSVATLTDYLQFDAVRSGAARRRANRDYEEARKQKEVASKYSSVWRKLLSEPEPSLLNLFLQKVQQATRVRPDRNHAAEFIRAQAGVKDIPVDRPRTRPKKGQGKSDSPDRRSIPRPKPQKERSSERVREPSFTLHGRTDTFKTGLGVLVAVFEKLASMDPSFCDRYSERYYGRTNRFMAKTKDLLYPRNPALTRYSHRLPGGWWLATNLSNQQKIQRIKEACKVVDLVFGRDLTVHIPTRSRKKRE